MWAKDTKFLPSYLHCLYPNRIKNIDYKNVTKEKLQGQKNIFSDYVICCCPNVFSFQNGLKQLKFYEPKHEDRFTRFILNFSLKIAILLRLFL